MSERIVVLVTAVGGLAGLVLLMIFAADVMVLAADVGKKRAEIAIECVKSGQALACGGSHE